MNRMPWIADWLGEVLLEAAKAMADGSYWAEERAVDYPDPPDFAGAFGGGDGGGE